MEAHLLSLNSFNRPTICKNSDAAYIHILYLLYLEKGKFQSHPDMGVGIRSRYRYRATDGIESELQNDIKQQIEKYLPELQYTDIICGALKDNGIGIIINTENGAYSIAYDSENDTHEIASSKVLDELLK